MATTKGKRGIKKSARLEKGKALRPVKALAQISLTFSTIKSGSKPQASTGE
jgi:hypothetical protein